MKGIYCYNRIVKERYVVITELLKDNEKYVVITELFKINERVCYIRIVIRLMKGRLLWQSY